MRLAMLAASAAFVSSACGPKPAPAPVPLLPGDGDKNVAKPPSKGKGEIEDAWTGRDLIPAPAPKAPTAITLPPIDTYKLANGLEVFVIKHDRMPVLSMQLAIKAGRMHEPRARLGVAELAADMLVKGTRKRDAKSLARAIDSVGGTISADATFEATLVSCSVLARDASTCFDLLPDLVTQPSFPDADITATRNELAGAIQQRLVDGGALASAHVQNLLWGNEHVRGWINSEQSIASLRRDDVVAWHKTWFVPNNAILVVAGDIDPKKIKGDIERAFGGWAKGVVPPAPSYKEPGLSGSKIRLVDKPGATVTHIRVAQYGIKHQDARFFDTLVWNHALGGGQPNSRLMKIVRADLGGKAASSFDRNLDRGSFVAQTVARSADAVATTKAMLDQIAKMEKDGPTREEVASAIANIGSNYPLRFQSASDIGAALVGAELHDYGREYLTNFPTQLAQVDVESAKKAAADVLDPKSYVVVLVGDAKDLEPQLKKEGWRFTKVAYTDPVSPPAQDPWDPALVTAAKKLVEEAVAAKGGKQKLVDLKGFHMVQAGGTTGPDGKLSPLEIDRVMIFPDKMRIDATVNGGDKVTIALDGKAGWQLAPDVDDKGKKTGKMALNDIQADPTIGFERWREPDLILLRAADAAAQITLAPDDTIDGQGMSVVRMRSPFAGVEVFLFVDKKTKLIRRMLYSDHGHGEIDDFEDYRDVGGLKIAHKRSSNNNGRITRLDVKTVDLNPKVDPKRWEKPPAP